MAVKTGTARSILGGRLKDSQERLERAKTNLDDAQEEVEKYTKEIAHLETIVADLTQDLDEKN